MRLHYFWVCLMLILFAGACNKNKECTCYHETQNACQKDRDCEWILRRNSHQNPGTNIYTIVTDAKCECKDKTVYESLAEKGFALNSDTTSLLSVASLSNDEFTFAVIRTEKGEEPVLISSAARNLIGGTNRSQVYTYFAETSSYIDVDGLNNSKSIRSLYIEQNVSNSIVSVNLGSIIYFVSGNGLKGIIRVNNLDMSADPKVLEMTVKYYNSGETFDAPADKGFTKVRRNISLPADNMTKGFYNIASGDNAVSGAELSFGAVQGDFPSSFDQCVLISPDARSKRSTLQNDGNVRTEFKEVTEGDFNTIYEFTDEPLARYSEVVHLPRSAFMPVIYMFRSSNGRTGLIKINTTSYLTFTSHEINFDLKYTE